ncbi:MAG: GNAT family N-acetyltransferase [Chloroflexi bacterium]|nr:GNAT family N-acetyltransferase [Chloroflexota bacterium]
MSDTQLHLIPANQFSVEELTGIYNQARADYLVPMSMNADRLAAYLRVYDVDLDHSWVAVDGEQVLGLAMLGVRPDRTWVTRLGVLPVRRRAGTGEALVRGLLQCTRNLGCRRSILEVIQGNSPAHRLFLKLGFREIRTLYVLRRPAGPLEPASVCTAIWLEENQALGLIRSYPARLAWTNEVESFINAGDAQGLRGDLGSGGWGWLGFREHDGILSHFVFHTGSGNPGQVAQALLGELYRRFPDHETYVENIPEGDPHLPEILRSGFTEVFRRTEMEWREPAD